MSRLDLSVGDVDQGPGERVDERLIECASEKMLRA